MTSEKEDQAKGRILTQFTEAKKRLIALDSEATHIATQLSSVGQALSAKYYLSPTIDNNLKTFPTAESIRELVDEAREVMRRRDEAQKQLRELGVDFK